MSALGKNQLIYVIEPVRPDLVTDSDAWTNSTPISSPWRDHLLPVDLRVT